MQRFLAIVLALAYAGLARGQNEPDSPYRWKPRVTAVTVFKNGVGYFMREGRTALRDGWCVSDALPPASFGTLAVFAHGADETVDLLGTGTGEVVAFDGVDAPADGPAKTARLESCLGLNLSLQYREGAGERNAAGKLVGVGGGFAILRSEQNSFAVPIESLLRLQILEQPLRVHVTTDKGRALSEATLGMAYLRKGITWIPEYSLTLLDDETAELTLRGTLVNEAEDLIHADVNFVVGVPNFLHTDYLAPVAVGQVIRTIGAQVAPREIMSQIMNSAAFTDIASRAAPAITEQPVERSGRDLDAVTGGLPPLDQAAGDFTVFNRKDLTLRVGEKAVVTLFKRQIKYGHVYRWSPPAPLRHFLVLENQTDSSWTTGPCLAATRSQVLSEDLLAYVPKGGRGEFPVTTAINVAVQQRDTEVGRKLKEHQPSHNVFWDLVTIEGEWQVRNFEPRPVQIVIEARVMGRPVEVSDDGVVTLDTASLRLIERAATVRWAVAVKPGETKILRCRAERFVPSN